MGSTVLLSFLSGGFLAFVYVVFLFSETPSGTDWAWLLAFFISAVPVLAAVVLTFSFQNYLRRIKIEKALLSEFYMMYSRCFLDFGTWVRIFRSQQPVDYFRLQKFRPDESKIVDAIFDSADIVDNRNFERILIFYYRLAALRRDISVIYDDLVRGQRVMTPLEKRLVLSRFKDAVREATSVSRGLAGSCRYRSSASEIGRRMSDLFIESSKARNGDLLLRRLKRLAHININA